MLYLKAANYEDAESEWLFQRSIPEDENGFINDYHGLMRDTIVKIMERMSK